MNKIDNDIAIEACARAAHEANRAYCIAIDDSSVKTAPPWDDLATTEEHRASVRKGVVAALAGNTPEQSHESWFAEKLANGWTYGPAKDPEKRQHPCMVPYADLPAAQRAKDMLFISSVRCMAAALGMKVRYPASPGYPARTRDWSTGEDAIG